MKKFTVLLLCFCLLSAAAAPAFAASPDARLYNVYGDDMLFQRESDAILAGEAPGGSSIVAKLFDQKGERVSAAAVTAEDGRFRVALPAPAGSYETYTVELSCNGVGFAKLERVVFGELWLAAGQSNMAYMLFATPEGKEMAETKTTGPHDVHVLYLPDPQIDGVYQTRYLPQTDAISCSWFTADDPQVYNVSAAAYFFAVRLQQMLDMPVGVLSVPLGGSAIASWLSRDAIDGSARVKQRLLDTNAYFTEPYWSDPDCSVFLDMTNLYNTNIAPLTNFRPQGTLWYQGCSELFLNHSTDYYRDCFDLLQDSYTADFGYTRGRMPFIFSQLACYGYGKGPFAVTAFNEVFTALAKADPSSRSEIPIYDLSLAFNEWGAIHPMTKKPIGERMFLAAQSIYGEPSPAGAAYCTKEEAKDGSVYLTFENAGSGLQFVGGTPRGFAICGRDGVAVEAQAELVSSDTVRVFSPFVASPAAAAYAAGDWSERANLWSTYDGKPFLPAAPAGICSPAIKHHYADNAWMNCEDLTFFDDSVNPGYIDAWNGSGCKLSLASEDKAEGSGALRICSQKPFFTLSPNISARDGLKTVVFDNVDPNWSDYGELRLQVKNCGKAPVRLNELRLYTGELRFFTPVCSETGLSGVTVPADGAWHLIRFDLNRLQKMGVAAAQKTNDELKEVKNVQLRWEGANCTLLLDDIRVLAEENAQSGTALHLIDWIKAVFAALRDMLQCLI